MSDDRVEDVCDFAADALDRVRAFFKPPVKITLLVRRCGVPNGTQDFLVTDDTADSIIAAITELERTGIVRRNPTS